MIDNEKLLQIKDELHNWCKEILNKEAYEKVAPSYPTINVNMILKNIKVELDELKKISDVLCLVEEYERNAKFIEEKDSVHKTINLLAFLENKSLFEEEADKGNLSDVKKRQKKIKGSLLELGFNKFVALGNKTGGTNIIAISAGKVHSVGLRQNGTVVATGVNSDHQCDVGDWVDIVAISAGDRHTVGLREDGTVIAVGKNDDNQCDVSEWKDIVSISAGVGNTVGLRKDGSVVATGSYDIKNKVHHLKGCIDISAEALKVVGLKNDGTLTERTAAEIQDVIAISSGSLHTVALRRDGTVYSFGSGDYHQMDTWRWDNIIAVSAGWRHTVGLKKDGTVIAVGDHRWGTCSVDKWSNIVAISAGEIHTLGLKRDGTVVAVGSNANGQCDVGDWGK